eukprot:Skav213301  [mRNA]  locus=scaffold2480:576712:577538:+ [translate_table: standard]
MGMDQVHQHVDAQTWRQLASAPCAVSTRYLSSSGVPEREAGAKKEVTWRCAMENSHQGLHQGAAPDGSCFGCDGSPDFDG